jgi:DNA-binding CsgD family transcriptional regulator
LELAAGNPLLLALAADLLTAAGPVAPEALAAHLDRELVMRVSPGEIDPACRFGLDLACLAPELSRELLDAVFGQLRPADSPDLVFDWLAGCGLLERAAGGLTMCDIVRPAWRAIAEDERGIELAQLRHAIRDHYVEMLERGRDWSDTMSTLLFVTPESDRYRSILPAPGGEELSLARPRPGEHDPIVELVRSHESDETAAVARGLLARSPGIFELCRDDLGVPVGLLGIIRLPEHRAAFDAAAAQGDPALALVRSYLAEQGGLRRSESALVVRWFTGEGPSRAIQRERVGHRMVGARSLAFTFHVVEDEAGEPPVGAQDGFGGYLLGRPQFGGRTWRVVAHHWRGRSRRALAAAAAGAPRWSASPAPCNACDLSLETLVETKLDSIGRETGLTPREQEVFRLLVLGRGTEEIATALGVRPRTAKFHQANVLGKLGIESRLELFRILL